MTGYLIPTLPAAPQPWADRAACLGDYTPFDNPNPAAAKAICFDCPVADECRDYAMSTNETNLVWGGLDPDERKALARGEKLKPIEHGTYRGWGAHRRRDEEPCDDCKEAKNAYQREQYAIRQARARKASA